MNDRTQWDDPRGERGDGNNRQDRSSREWQQQQDRGAPSRQQGGWHDDDERRSGSYRGNEWRGERDWGSPSYGSGNQQPQQREWRGAGERSGGGSYGGGSETTRDRSWEAGGDYGQSDRAWGGSSDRYGSRPTSSGSMHRDEIGHPDETGETTRMRQDREMREHAYRGPDYGGWGPSDYTRSDERIREDANDRLTDDPRLDARRISVAVKEGEVTLSGTVGSRDAKRRAEDCIDRVSGVKHVQNNLHVEQRGHEGSESWSTGSPSGHVGAPSPGSGPKT